MKKIRFLKVYKKAQQRHRYYAIVPEIRLEGQWLEKIGFEIGSTIQVNVCDKQLQVSVIRKAAATGITKED
jgi:toxic protein SymE